MGDTAALPWRTDDYRVVSPDGDVAVCLTRRRGYLDAELIVRAVNHHEELVAALRTTVEIGAEGCMFDLCDGPDAPYTDMKTCRSCYAQQIARDLLAKLEQQP